jgi:hypothetical protein
MRFSLGLLNSLAVCLIILLYEFEFKKIIVRGKNIKKNNKKNFILILMKLNDKINITKNKIESSKGTLSPEIVIVNNEIMINKSAILFNFLLLK